MEIESSVTAGETLVEAKIDPVTALQDSIDRLSLAMFEALRGLRDAVAPESGNVGAGETNGEPDFEEFYQAYRSGDEETVNAVRKACGGTTPTSREDFIRIHAKIEMGKDFELVSRLASTVLTKSAQVNARVSSLPGMNRTRTEQLKRIEELIEANQSTKRELDEQFALAEERREQIRKVLRDRTGEALGINAVGE
jgi:hypothetical protein